MRSVFIIVPWKWEIKNNLYLLSVYIYIYICISTHTYVHVCIYTYMHIHILSILFNINIPILTFFGTLFAWLNFRISTLTSVLCHCILGMSLVNCDPWES